MRKERQRLKSREKEEKKGLFVRNNMIRKLKLVLGLVLRWNILNLKKKKKKKTDLHLLLLLKNNKERFKRPWDNGKKSFRQDYEKYDKQYIFLESL